MKRSNSFFKYLPAAILLAGLLGGVSLHAQETSETLQSPAQKFSAPGNEYRTPAGWKKENLTREVLINDFSTPPPGYGNVAFYWWLGDPLTKERLSWQLERLA
ncbi:MAG: hypothetical protein LBS79_09775, partial [Tannerella sp.]|nr:hypothetical protein [Tannerella sp.]